ncbi:right-handed parallel beta-helix repeat-containing protein [Mariniflexile sp. AS56]|uniref:right-handed parallel beta-helix repeat-containing protein n=1 Tax=Mariniflexile sp. AS56 TaxID=3063957 RepID=UPI0026EE26E5|nr:right-handed parallel beta-helix repeat-containing protein [Mariniflexile sp. AS56]MDO7172631.1 right-handed parallel beta-helix repeat-containing protein [Mariniflexile sp. AS56]
MAGQLIKGSKRIKILMRVIYILSLLFCCSLSLNAQQYFHVSPIGNDINPGTKEAPLATLTAARDAIRQHKTLSKKQHAYTVIVEEGYYTMKEPLELFPEDGGTKNSPITYKAAKNAKPTFSGGKIITGFSVNEKGVWEVKIPESAYYKWQFDQLYVNGKRAVLARTPNSGFLEIDSVQQHIWEKGPGKVAPKAQQKLFFDKNMFAALVDITKDEIEEVRFKAYHKWDYTLRHIDAIDTDSLSITTSGKGMKPWNEIKKGGRIVFENYKGALDTPGEWFLNQKGILYYVPQPNESPDNSTVIAPVLQQLISIKGSAIQNKYVEYIRFEGLGFEYCHYEIPKSGSEPNQAAAKLNAAIYLEGAKNITFSHCEISKTGQHALWFGKGCSNAFVENTYLHNLGGGGIYLGDFKALEGKEHTHNINIHNNIIQSGGKEFPAAVGIWVGHSSDNKVTHNDIGNFYYTGISVGWVWGYAPSLAKRNTIAYNHIHHIGWDLLSDMAGIYTLGESEGTRIENNVIHDIHAYSYGGWGMYADEGSTGIVFKNNVVYNTKTGGFQQNYGKENLIQNNILAFAKKYQMQCTIAEAHTSFTFTNNIVIFKEGMLLKGAWDKVIAKMDTNLYWNTSLGTYNFNGKTFKVWQQLGHDNNSIIGDPYFKDASNFDFKFERKANFKKINFKPFDYTKSGIYGDGDWIKKAKLTESITIAFDKAVEENMKKNIKR